MKKLVINKILVKKLAKKDLASVVGGILVRPPSMGGCALTRRY